MSVQLDLSGDLLKDIYMLLLERDPKESERTFFEQYLDESPKLAIDLIINSLEFLEKMSYTDIGCENDCLKINNNEYNIKNIFLTLLGRSPIDSELRELIDNSHFSVSSIRKKIVTSKEFIRLYYGVDDDFSIFSETLCKKSLTGIHRIFNYRNQGQPQNANLHTKIKKLLEGNTNIRVGLLLFGATEQLQETERVTALSMRIHKKIEFIAFNSIEHFMESSHDNIDVFITNNNLVYGSVEKLKSFFNEGDIITACWTFDNHHLFDFTIQTAKIFDFIFPAHSQYTSYFYGYKAIVGPVITCPIFQFNHTNATECYDEFESFSRDNLLYGRFTSYHGELAARDIFLSAIKDALPENKISMLSLASQDWYQMPLRERFFDIFRHKCSIISNIHCDVPIRFYDSLLCGQIPIVPYGLADISQNMNIYRDLPVVFFIPNSVDSVIEAHRKAIYLFDSLGIEAARKRHRFALNNHMLSSRVADIVTSIFDLSY